MITTYKFNIEDIKKLIAEKYGLENTNGIEADTWKYKDGEPDCMFWFNKEE